MMSYTYLRSISLIVIFSFMLTNLFSQCDENKISSIIDNLSANKAKPEIDIYENINLLQKILKEAKKCDSEYSTQAKIISYESLAISHSNLNENQKCINILKEYIEYLNALDARRYGNKMAYGNYLIGLELIKLNQEDYLHHFESALNQYSVIDSLNPSERIILYEVAFFLRKKTKNDPVLSQNLMSVYNRCKQESSEDFDLYKALFGRLEIREKLSSKEYVPQELYEQIEANLSLLDNGIENDFYNREKALNYRYKIMVNNLSERITGDINSKDAIEGYKLSKSINQKNYSDSILILEFALDYYNRDIKYEYDLKMDAIEFIPVNIIDKDYLICNYLITEALEYHVLSLNSNTRLMELGLRFDSISNVYLKRFPLSKGDVEVFKKELSNFKNIHFHSLAMNEYNSIGIDSLKLKNYFDIVINSEISNDSILLRNKGDALILSSIIDYNEKSIDTGIEILDHFQDDKSIGIIIEGLMIKYLSTNNLRDKSSIIDISQNYFDQIAIKSKDDYKKYYSLMSLYLTELIKSKDVDRFAKILNKILEEKDPGAFLILSDVIPELCEASANHLDFREFYYKCADKFEKIKFCIVDADERHRKLSRITYLMKSPLDTIIKRTEISDSIYYTKAISLLKEINDKNQLDSVYLMNYCSRLADYKCDNIDEKCTISTISKALDYSVDELLFIDTTYTQNYLLSISTLIYKYSLIHEQNKADSIFNEFQILIDNKKKSGIDIESDYWENELTQVTKIVNSEKLIMDESLFGETIRDSIEFYINRKNALISIDLENESLPILYKLEQLYYQLDELSYVDSTLLSSIFSSIGSTTDSIEYYYKSIEMMPKVSQSYELIILQYSEIIHTHYRRSEIHLIEKVKKEMDEWVKSVNYQNSLIYKRVVLSYHLNLAEIDSIIIKAKPLYKKIDKRGIVSREENSIIESYAGALLIKNRYDEVIELYDNLKFDMTDNLYYGDIYQKSLNLCWAYSLSNIDSSLHYYQEMISFDLARPQRYRDSDNLRIKRLNRIHDVSYLINQNENPIIKINGIEDTIAVDSIVFNKTVIDNHLELMGSLDCHIFIYTKENDCVVSITDHKLNNELLILKWDKKNLSSRSIIQKNWYLIEDKLQNFKNLYITTHGDFDFVNFSTLKSSKFNVDLNRKYNIFRLKNELVLDSYLIPPQDQKLDQDITIELFGSPKYSSTNDLSNLSFTSQAVRALKSKDNEWLQLPQTKIEIDSIFKLMSDYNPISHTGSEASEDYLMSISNPDILHISTHGFIDTTGNTNKYGIVLANANDTGLPEDNDGYFYALDIAQLDLKDTRLAVISACESGIYKKEGDKNIIEALFEAGVDHQLVTLWKIDDEATMDLMCNFYNNLSQTRDIRYSYELAQNFMREKYVDPYYWGSFILLSQDLNYTF